MSNLKPLVWFERKDSNVYGNIKHCAQGAGIFYTIMPTSKDVEIFWGDSIDGSSGNRTLKDIEDAKEWVRTDHYPSKMQPYVKPSPTWIDVNDRLPSELGRCLVIHQNTHRRMTKNPSINIDWYDASNESWVFFKSGIMQEVTHWMPLPEPPISKESDR